MVKRIDAAEGLGAWQVWLQAPEPKQIARSDMAVAVRYTLQIIAQEAPGSSVEIRVPPFGATQVIPGASHRRGTPPAVIEMGPQTWLRLASGQQNWEDAVATGEVDASGQSADLAPYLPLRVTYRDR